MLLEDKSQATKTFYREILNKIPRNFLKGGN